MARRDDSLQARLDRDLADLKLLEIAKSYREVLDEAARKGSSMLEVLSTLIGLEQTARQQRALERRSCASAASQAEDLDRGINSTSLGLSPRRPSCGCSTATSSSDMGAPC